MGERFIRKTVPQSRDNKGPVLNTPDVPIIDKIPLHKLSTFCGRMTPHDGTFVTQGIVLEPGKYNPSTRGQVVTPVSRLPLIDVFQVSRGGGRVYGGGTSEEALRRAKRKAKNRISK